jgi:hypothetical protein
MKNPFKLLLLLLATASLAVSACKKDKNDDDPQAGIGEIKFTVDGTSHSHDEINGTLTYTSDDTTQFLTVWFDPADQDHYFIALGMSEFSPFGSSAGEDVWNMFAPGTKTFAREDVQPNGAVVEWRAPDGTYFSSTRGDQTGSTFTITQRDDYPGDLFLGFEARGTFTCKVYDANGNSRTISNASWQGIFPLY